MPRFSLAALFCALTCAGAANAAVLQERSPTAHREAETAKAHRG